MPWCKQCNWFTEQTVSGTTDVRAPRKSFDEKGKLSIYIFLRKVRWCKKCNSVLESSKELVGTITLHGEPFHNVGWSDDEITVSPPSDDEIKEIPK